MTHRSRLAALVIDSQVDDIETDDLAAEVARLTALGAREVEQFPRWVVMEAPTGHRFCVVNPQRGDFNTSPDVNEWE